MRQITLGCSGTPPLYCPTQSVTRSQMAAFLIRAFDNPNLPPSVSPGSDQLIRLPLNSVTLNGAAADDGLPTGGALTAAWSKMSGPGTVNFSNPNAAVTQATFSAAGLYVLRLTANDMQLTASADVIVNVLPANQAPTVNAGPDQTITLPNTASLNGTATDDALPADTLSLAWSLQAGPASVLFSNGSGPATTAIFSTPGNYILRLTANDLQLTTFDEVMVTVNADPTPPPPDPNLVAPPLDRTVATTMGAATQFL